MQVYDSVAIKADVELGGSDQLFNLLFAREVQRSYGQEPEDILTLPLLEGTDGTQKMSKSAGNYIGIAEPPEEIYGKTMSIPDRVTERYLRLVSRLPEGEMTRVVAQHPRDAKASLARALVARLHGAAAAERAEQDFNAKFRQRDVGAAEIPEVAADGARDAASFVVEVMRWAPSVSQVRRVADQGGLSVNGEKVRFDHPLRDGDVVKFGKKNFARVRLR
jgi:tyrosyl-tRNA synthetase